MLSPFAPWCAETCISASVREGKKPHQGFADQNLIVHQGIEWSKSTLALRLPEWAGKTASGPAVAANKGPKLILQAQSDCPTADGRVINYSLQDANGNSVSDYTVVEHQTDTSRASSAFGPGTSFQSAPPGTFSGFLDTLNPGPFQKPGNSIQTFTITTANPSPNAPQQPVMIQSVNGQMNGSLGIWFQFPQVFVNGVPTPKQCVFVQVP